MQQRKRLGLMLTLVTAGVLMFSVFPSGGREAPVFVGSGACASCHPGHFEAWQASHHAKAMGVAGEATVLGDFENAAFVHRGGVSRFYRREGRFFVHTRGPGGLWGDFEVTHTFGWYPLQQYLVPFPGGRLQCLPIAWDQREKRWFHLYPDLTLDPEEWIYWTNQGQNWNAMCADCHSTGLHKGYDPATDTYATRWAEISVGCEACHGPASDHLAWARQPKGARSAGETGSGLPVRTRDITARQQAELCAPCHSRRSMLGDIAQPHRDLLDVAIPRLLDAGLYHADGQILDEVYVYGSFLQSRMYMVGVRCSDCHDVHDLSPRKQGNALCLRCHQEAVYDTREHHYHRKEGGGGRPLRGSDGVVLSAVGSGARCVACHMPTRTYMVIDDRPDHSIRIPRPDLGVALGMPDSCTRCHGNQTPAWSAAQTKVWYKGERADHYGAVFQAARKGERPTEALIRLAVDPFVSPLVRATALSLLQGEGGTAVIDAFGRALTDRESLVRRTGLNYLPPLPDGVRSSLVGPLLSDPVKGVRVEAAMALTALPAAQLAKRFRGPFDKAMEELWQVNLYGADFASGRLNLGGLCLYAGQPDQAEAHFKKALAIDPDFHAARTNLAVLYNRQGKNELAEAELRGALARDDALYDVHYLLGLLLAEKTRYKAAVVHLQRAAAGMPDSGKTHHNLGKLLAFLHRDTEARAALNQALSLDPRNLGYLLTLARFYLERGQLGNARRYAEEMIRVDPENTLARQLLEHLGDGDSPPAVMGTGS